MLLCPLLIPWKQKQSISAYFCRWIVVYIMTQIALHIVRTRGFITATNNSTTWLTFLQCCATSTNTNCKIDRSFVLPQKFHLTGDSHVLKACRNISVHLQYPQPFSGLALCYSSRLCTQSLNNPFNATDRQLYMSHN